MAGLAGVSGAVFEMLGGFLGVERWEEQSRGVTGGVVELWDMFYRGRVRRRLEELLSRQVEEGVAELRRRVENMEELEKEVDLGWFTCQEAGTDLAMGREEGRSGLTMKC